MNKIVIYLRNIIAIIWLLLALFISICMLSYNEFNVIEFNNNTLLIIQNDDKELNYKKGDLLIVKKVLDNKTDVGDKLFYYNNNVVNYGTVEGKKQDENKVIYTIKGNKVSEKYIIGKANNKSYHNYGKLLEKITSKWGFIIIVVIPTLLAIFYEAAIIIKSLKNSK